MNVRGALKAVLFKGVSATAVLKRAGTLGSKLCAKIEPSPEDKGIVKEVDL
ncbi:hypothetical protein [Holospora elegans]|uniref:hypothetical protein n=1 Tax=Holospora elegans TaxID=431043 RepID=UPI00139F2AD2|nr:hypothetical protein [Holospora elegans]